MNSLPFCNIGDYVHLFRVHDVNTLIFLERKMAAEQILPRNIDNLYLK